MRMELVNPEFVILNEIENKELKQKDIAQTMALIMKLGQTDEVNWKKVSEAIINRWSKSGFVRIKEMAWSGKCFDD